MSGDEIFAFVISLVVAGYGWGKWYWSAAMISRPGGTGAAGVPLFVTPVLCMVGLYLVLAAFADAEVRANVIYQLFYLVMGAGWVAAAMMAMPLFGVSPRDDALERGNDAAMLAVSGAIVGLTAAFAGSNIGDGPGWWVIDGRACGIYGRIARSPLIDHQARDVAVLVTEDDHVL